MDIITLSTLAITLAKPFLEKTQEGVARKVGEDIWNLIKSPFVKKGVAPPEQQVVTEETKFTNELQAALTNDKHLYDKLLKLVTESQQQLSTNFQQNINSFDKVEKQVNIQNNEGNISL